MSNAPKQVQVSFTQGYALCSPKGVLLGHSYRATASDSIASVFQNPEFREQFWSKAQSEGWTVEFVYSRLFTPVYFAATFAVAEAVGAA